LATIEGEGGGGVLRNYRKRGERLYASIILGNGFGYGFEFGYEYGYGYGFC
jgi:hypothetical protein